MTEQKPKGTPKKILLATDLSARCDRALDRAAALATAWSADMTVVHALEQDFARLDRRPPAWQKRDPEKIVEDQLRRDLLGAVPRVSVVVEQADPTELLLRVAKARGGDLIVTGIARDETLGRFGLGTTVDRLLRRSRVPVLIVKDRVRGPYKNIIVGTDFSDSSRVALETAMSFFPHNKLSLFHAYDPPMAGIAGAPPDDDDFRGAVTNDAAAFLASAGVAESGRRRFGILTERGHPGEVIHQYARDRGVDLVVIGSQGRSALRDIFLGSTAKEILSMLACDALVVREPGAAVEA